MVVLFLVSWKFGVVLGLSLIILMRLVFCSVGNLGLVFVLIGVCSNMSSVVIL